METIKATDVVRARTHFKTSDGSYFCYDHIEGVLATIVTDGCRKGIFLRTDSTASQLVREFHKEERHGVPVEQRLYLPMTEYEWRFKLQYTINDIHNTLDHITL